MTLKKLVLKRRCHFKIQKQDSLISQPTMNFSTDNRNCALLPINTRIELSQNAKYAINAHYTIYMNRLTPTKRPRNTSTQAQSTHRPSLVSTNKWFVVTRGGRAIDGTLLLHSPLQVDNHAKTIKKGASGWNMGGCNVKAPTVVKRLGICKKLRGMVRMESTQIRWFLGQSDRRGTS
jgi:hypothetical protein